MRFLALYLATPALTPELKRCAGRFQALPAWPHSNQAWAPAASTMICKRLLLQPRPHLLLAHAGHFVQAAAAQGQVAALGARLEAQGRHVEQQHVESRGVRVLGGEGLAAAPGVLPHRPAPVQAKVSWWLMFATEMPQRGCRQGWPSPVQRRGQAGGLCRVLQARACGPKVSAAVRRQVACTPSCIHQVLQRYGPVGHGGGMQSRGQSQAVGAEDGCL